MTFIFLIRHALCDEVGRIFAGRMPNVHLNQQGKAQAGDLASRLAEIRLDAVVSSPLERARETAAVIAHRQGLSLEISENLGELDAGAWTGCEFSDLSGLILWKKFNTFRSCIRAPGGELMLEAQVRIIAELERLREKYRAGRLAIVSHGDVIKAAVAHYAGVHLDLFQRIEISPCSLTIVALSDSGPRVLCVNDTGGIAAVMEGAQ